MIVRLFNSSHLTFGIVGEGWKLQSQLQFCLHVLSVSVNSITLKLKYSMYFEMFKSDTISKKISKTGGSPKRKKTTFIHVLHLHQFSVKGVPQVGWLHPPIHSTPRCHRVSWKLCAWHIWGEVESCSQMETNARGDFRHYSSCWPSIWGITTPKHNNS